MSEKLKIAIAGIYEETENYRAALKELGAEGICAESFDPQEFDGLILPGGDDIAPHLYGCENNGSEDIDEHLDLLQLGAMDAFVKAGKPILGICKGVQVINVYFGGTLIQHLDCWPKHRRIEGKDNAHETTAEPGSDVYRLYGAVFRTNSAHHQALDRIGTGLKVVQRAEEVVEGVEHESLPVWGVQWHPERMCFAKAREDTVDGSLLISMFLESCRNTRLKNN